MSKAQCKKKDQLKIARLEIVSTLYKRGYSYRKIREEVMKRLDLSTYSLQTVQNDVQTLLREWRDSRLEDTDELVTLELARIDEACRELWEQWEESKEQDLGNPAYIVEIRKQLEERRKLLGLYAPEKKEVSGGLSFASLLVESGMMDEAEEAAGLK